MLYFIVRVFVYVLAILLTLWLLPGVHIDMHQFTDIPMAEVRAELATDPDITPEQEQLALTAVSAVQVVGPLLLILGMAFAFWFWNWLLWPVVLFFTGRVVLWSFGLLLIAGNALLFYVAVVNGGDGILVDSPALLWCALGGMSMAFWLFFLEGVTGLDSPLHYAFTVPPPLLADTQQAHLWRSQLLCRKPAHCPVARHHHDVSQGHRLRQLSFRTDPPLFPAHHLLV